MPHLSGRMAFQTVSVHPGSDLSQGLLEGDGAARPHVSGGSHLLDNAQTAKPDDAKMATNCSQWQKKAKGVPIC